MKQLPQFALAALVAGFVVASCQGAEPYFRMRDGGVASGRGGATAGQGGFIGFVDGGTGGATGTGGSTGAGGATGTGGRGGAGGTTGTGGRGGSTGAGGATGTGGRGGAIGTGGAMSMGGSTGAGGRVDSGSSNCITNIIAGAYAFSPAAPCSECKDNQTLLDTKCMAMIDCLEPLWPCSGNCLTNCLNSVGGSGVLAGCVNALTTAACQ